MRLVHCTFDRMGNCTAITEAGTPANDQRYGYDARNRLVGLNTGTTYTLNGLGHVRTT